MEKAIAITQMFHNSEDKMPIKNRGFFTDVEFFADYNFQLIGECAGKKLLLIGKTKAYGDPIVATSQTDKPSQEDLYASDLYELMKINQEPIKVTGLS